METETNKTLVFCMCQIITLYNIAKLGWSVEKIGKFKYRIRKEQSSENFSMVDFLESVVY